MECAPTVSDDVVKVATALLFRFPVPRVVVPSRKVTVPVGVPEVLGVIVAVNVTWVPLVAEAAELTNTAVVAAAGAGVMVSAIGPDVLPAKFALPAYLQVIECVPTVSVDVAKVATALLFRVPVPSEVAPSRKLAVPVGVPEVLDVIVAVNVTWVPLVAEATELTNAVVVATGMMVSVAAAEVLALKLESPPYAAVMECVPTVSIEIVKVAIPLLFRVPVPSVVVPSRKVTEPVGVPLLPGVTVAVNVIGVP
jgi:hypothetical protein